MKLTNMEALQAQQALAELGKRDDIPIKASLDVAIIANMIETQTKAYGQVLQNIYKKHSIKPEQDGDSVQFTCLAEGETEEETTKLRAEKLEAFGDEFNELLEAKTQELSFQKIKLPSDIKIKPEILKSLVDFVEVE